MTEAENQLRELMKADAEAWAQVTTGRDLLVGEPDKIAVAKKHAHYARAARERTSAQFRKVVGTLRIADTPDKLCIPTVKCVQCGAPFASSPRSDASLYCSQICRQRAQSVRRALRKTSYG